MGKGGGGHSCGKQCCRYQRVGLHGKVTVVVAIISGILWGQDVKILVWFGGNALACSSGTTSNVFISKTQDFFLIFYSISEMCIKFRTFGKKDEFNSLIICEIIVSERGCY